MGNDALLYRAIYNVIENSIKYNHTGGQVSVQSKAEQGQIIITILDSGCGIPAEDQGRSLSRFSALTSPVPVKWAAAAWVWR